jgi:hypothetical protein
MNEDERERKASVRAMVTAIGLGIVFWGSLAAILWFALTR